VISMDSPRRGLLDAAEAAASAARGPDPVELRRRLRRRRQRRAAFGATLLVAVAIAVPVVLSRSVPSVRLTPVPAVPASGSAAAGMRLLSFHGLTIQVPKQWPLNAFICAQPYGNTVIVAPGPVTLWMVEPARKVQTVVELRALSEFSGYDSDKRQAAQPRTTLRAPDGGC